jgi:hypothetical protein
MKIYLKYLFVSLSILSGSNAFSQVGIGTNSPAASAALEVTSDNNNKGILIPRITAAQKNAIISPAEGLLIFQTTAPSGFYYYSGTAWKLIVNQADTELKVDKVAGKDLSSNDYSTAEKTKLAAITGINTGDQTSISGNAGTATKLAAPININGVAFDGSSDITIFASAGAEQLAGTSLKSTITGSSLTSVGTLSNLTVTNPIVGSITGNAASATTLTGLSTTIATLNNLSGTNTGDQDLSALASKTDLNLKANSADVTSSLAAKVDKVTGKDLSSNDYTDAEKTKLAGILGTNTGDQTTITGNAGTATKLAATKNINGVAFDGSADITVTADAGTLTGTALNSTVTESSLTSVGTLTNLSVTNAIAGSITGNAGTATKLVAPKNINGVAFDGSSDITISAAAAADQLSGTTLKSTVTGSSLTSVGTLSNLTVTNPIVGSITGNAATATSLTGLNTTITTLNNLSGINTGDQDLSTLASKTALDLKANSADVTTSLATKVDKVTGKDLSSNDYTNAEKTKLADISGTNTGDQTTITGNAGTATKLAATKKINNVAFDGSADITVTADAGTLTGTTLNSAVTGSSLTSVGTLSNLTVTNPIVGSITGNAATATSLTGLNTTITTLNNLSGINTGDQDLSALASKTALDLKANSADVTTSLATKVDKVTGKDLSSNDYTNAEKTKLADISGTNTGDQTTITGNAGTATKLAAAIKINDVAFDGSADITVTADAGTLTGTTLKSTILGSSLTSVGTLSDLTVTNAITGSVTGNAGTATKLAATKKINDVAFDGSADITITADAGTLTGTVPITKGGTGSSTQNFVDLSNAQTIAGGKTFSSDVTINGISIGKGLNSKPGNTALGSNALKANTTGDGNTASGNFTLFSNTSGGANTALGSDALYNNTSGNDNIAIGNASLLMNTTGGANIAIGVNSLRMNAAAGHNTAVGYHALYQNISGNYNASYGSRAMMHATGSYNNAFGANSLYSSSGSENNAFGEGALYANTTGRFNTAMGHSALSANSTGNGNTGFGFRSLTNNSTGNNNTALGDGANVATGALYNATALGFGAIVAASNQIQLGNSSVENVKTSGTLTLGGVTYPKVDGSNGQFLSTNGSGTLAWVTPSATSLTGIIPVENGGTGSSTKNFVDLSNAQTIAGSKTFSSDLTINGITLGKGLNSKPANTVFGSNALKANTTGDGNTAFGSTSLFSNTTGLINTAIGSEALYSNTDGSENIAIGSSALSSNTTGGANVAIGVNSLRVNTTAGHNTAVGYHALYQNLTGTGNSAFGSRAMFYANGGSDNSAFGAQSLSSNSGAGNNAFGNGALYNNTTGSLNTGMGYSSLDANTTGSRNTGFGFRSLNNNSTGSNNTALGDDADVATGNLNNAMALGSGAIVTASNQIQLGNSSVENVKTSGTITAGSVTYPNIAGTENQVLITNGSGVVAFGSIPTLNQNTTGTAANVSGIVAVANGGTGATTKSEGFDALSPMSTSGDIIYGGANGTGTRLGKGSDGQVLTLSSGVPSWANASGGGSGVPYTGATAPVDLGQNGISASQFTGGALSINSINGMAISIGASDLTETNFLGSSSMEGASGGFANTAFGHLTLSETSGMENTAFGAQAMRGNTSGSGNTALGRASLIGNTTGSNNTALGMNTKVSSPNLTNTTAIGYGAEVGTDNTIQLGNADVTKVKTSGTLTAGTITYPNTDGTSGQVLSTNGSGTLAWVTPSATSLTGIIPVENGGTGSSTKNFVDLSNAQTIAGSKTFSSDLTINGITLGKGLNSKPANTVFGSNALKANTTGDGNTAFGSTSLFSNTTGLINTAIGSEALYSNTDGSENIAIGSSALSSNTTGGANVAIGVNSLRVNTTAGHNTAVGYHALYQNLTGTGNSAFGSRAMFYANGGSDNSAFGAQSLSSNSGAGNNAFGNGALYNNTTGSLNTGMGYSSLDANTTGSRNTGFGFRSLNNNSTGSNNTALGDDADVATGNLNNAMALGSGAIVTASNQIQLGNAAVLNVNTSGTVNAAGYVTTSDSRLKSNVVSLSSGLSTIKQLNPVRYFKKNNLASANYTVEENGFIAQELQKILPFVVKEGLDKDKLLSVDYTSIIPLLTKGIQEQQTMIETQQKQIEAQQKQLNEIKELLLKLTADKTPNK